MSSAKKRENKFFYISAFLWARKEGVKRRGGERFFRGHVESL
jgi:hypothetical protein